MIANKVVFVLSSVAALTNALPQQINLISKLPEKPIEDPAEWAWGEHPKNGFGFKARNGLSVEQCLKNPKYIKTPACKFPAEVCIEFPEYASLAVCADAQYSKSFCLANPVLVSANGCKKFKAEVCSTDISLAQSSACADAKYPKSFCLANPVLVSANGCQKFKSDICASDVKLAQTSACADAKYPKEFCVANPVLVEAKGCREFLADVCSTSVKLAESPSCAGAADEITFLQCVSDGAVCRAKICDKKIPNKEFCPAL